MLHMKRAREFHCFNCGRIEALMARTFLNGDFGQMAVGPNDGFQNDLPFLTVQAGRTGISLQLSDSSPERLGEPAMIYLDVGSRGGFCSLHRRFLRSGIGR